MDGIFHLVRAFENDEIVHVDDSVDPVRCVGGWVPPSFPSPLLVSRPGLMALPSFLHSDLETITGELCLKDLATIDRAIEAAKLEHKRIKVRTYVCVPHACMRPWHGRGSGGGGGGHGRLID